MAKGTTRRTAAIASAEYCELGANLRATWGYISDLTKMWVAFEVISIILVLVCLHFHQGLPTATEQPAGHSNLPTSYFQQKYFYGSLIFVALAGGLSFGAAAQNNRLFKSATKFVERGSHIEEQDYFDLEEPKSREAQSPYLFMRQELYAPGRLELSTMLTVLYILVGLIWGGVFYSIWNQGSAAGL